MILGSTGAVGTAIEQVCLNRNIDFISYSHKDFDIRDKDKLKFIIEETNPDIIVNCVAIVGINQCYENIENSYRINTISVANLCEIIKDKDIVLIQPSTHTVFNGYNLDYYDEESIPNPINTYGLSKYFSEQIVQMKLHKYYIVRFPTLFGPRRNENIGFVDKVIKWIEEGRELHIATDKLDSPSYTIDVANEVINLVEEKSSYGIYHITNSGGTSLYELVKKILEFTNSKNKLIKAKDSDFLTNEPKSVKTKMKTCKRTPLRKWDEALISYLNER